MNKRTSALLMATAMAINCALPAGAAFADTEGHWASDYINRWQSEGIMVGDGQNFRPDAKMTRAEFATVMTAIMQYKNASSTSFTDVSADDWYARYVLAAHEAGIMNGVGDGSFGANQNITREQAAVIIANVLNFELDSDYAKQFKDYNKISSWATGAIGALAKEGLMAGYEGNCNPKNDITRAEVCTILDGAFSQIIKEEGTYEGAIDGNLVVNAPDVTLNGVTVHGNLIIAEGVGDGDITLNNVAVDGEVIVRGGGVNSINFTGKCKIPYIALERRDGGVRLNVEGKNNTIGEVNVNEGAKSFIVDGTVTTLNIFAQAVEAVINGTVTNLNVSMEAGNVTIEVSKGGVVTNLVVNSNGFEISGSGTVKNAEVGKNASDVTIGTNGTKVTNNSSDKVSTPSGDVKPGGSSSGGSSSDSGSSGGGGGSSGGGNTGDGGNTGGDTGDGGNTGGDTGDGGNTGGDIGDGGDTGEGDGDDTGDDNDPTVPDTSKNTEASFTAVIAGEGDLSMVMEGNTVKVSGVVYQSDSAIVEVDVNADGTACTYKVADGEWKSGKSFSLALTAGGPKTFDVYVDADGDTLDEYRVATYIIDFTGVTFANYDPTETALFVIPSTESGLSVNYDNESNTIYLTGKLNAYAVDGDTAVYRLPVDLYMESMDSTNYYAFMNGEDLSDAYITEIGVFGVVIEDFDDRTHDIVVDADGEGDNFLSTEYVLDLNGISLFNPDAPTVTVKYCDFDGNVLTTDVVNVGSTALYQAATQKDNLVFEGWVSSKDSTELFDFNNTPLTEDVIVEEDGSYTFTVYALYSADLDLDIDCPTLELEKVGVGEYELTGYITSNSTFNVNFFVDCFGADYEATVKGEWSPNTTYKDEDDGQDDGVTTYPVVLNNYIGSSLEMTVGYGPYAGEVSVDCTGVKGYRIDRGDDEFVSIKWNWNDKAGADWDTYNLSEDTEVGTYLDLDTLLEKYIPAEDFNKFGLDFVKWEFDVDSDVYTYDELLNEDGDFLAVCDITATAVWEAEEYTVTLDSRIDGYNGTYGGFEFANGKATATVNVLSDEFALPVLTAVDKTFLGWHSTTSCDICNESTSCDVIYDVIDDTVLTSFGGDFTLYALWDSAPITVTVACGDDKVEFTPDSGWTDNGDGTWSITAKASEITMPTLTTDVMGYEADGWYLDGVRVDRVSKSGNYVAKVKPIVAQIMVYNALNGEYVMWKPMWKEELPEGWYRIDENTVAMDYTIETGAITLPDDLMNRTGYDLTGYGMDSNSSSTTQKVTFTQYNTTAFSAIEDITIYPFWSYAEVTIYFYMNPEYYASVEAEGWTPVDGQVDQNGIGLYSFNHTNFMNTVPYPSGTYKQGYGAPTRMVVKDGDEWVDFTMVDEKGDAVASTRDYAFVDGMTLSRIPSEQSFTVSYELDGGEFTDAREPVSEIKFSTEFDDLIYSETLEKDGYTFFGWSFSATGFDDYQDFYFTSIEEVMQYCIDSYAYTLYLKAVWEEIPTEPAG